MSTYRLNNSQAIMDFLRANRSQLHEMGVRKIGLFGSFIRGEQHPNSDVDILFDMDDMSFDRWMTVWNFLEDGLGLKVDLVPEKNLRDELRPYVMSELVYIESH